MSIYIKIFPLIFLIAPFFCQDCTHNQEGGRDDFFEGVFPENFLFGYSSSAYQTEGGYNEGGKGQSNWDNFTHSNPSVVVDRSNGDVAADFYHKYREDIALLKKSGAKAYRFSISWTRILPNGDCSIINKVGLSYYNNVIDALVENGIEPVITIYHYDLPQVLEAQGGWLNESTAFHFAEFSRVVYQNFGDRVKYWTTLNQANVYCEIAYGSDASFAPGIKRSIEATYRCTHNLLKAHGLSYRIYEKEFKQSQKGRVGISVWCAWFEPRDPTKAEDIAASLRALEFSIGSIINPLLVGEYPSEMRRLVDEKSNAEGRKKSRLPTFSSKWKKIITGTLDYIGVNHYATFLAYPSEAGNPISPDSNTGLGFDPNWPRTALDRYRVVPYGFRRILKYLGAKYGLDMFVLENGRAEFATTGLHNPATVEYFRLYIDEMLKAVVIDGVSVMGYVAWSLVDNFEWLDGFTLRFGAFYIDYAGDNHQRIPKDSAKFLRKVFRDNGFPRKNPGRTLEGNFWEKN